jgi:hypothetical protein
MEENVENPFSEENKENDSGSITILEERGKQAKILIKGDRCSIIRKLQPSGVIKLERFILVTSLAVADSLVSYIAHRIKTLLTNDPPAVMCDTVKLKSAKVAMFSDVRLHKDKKVMDMECAGEDLQLTILVWDKAGKSNFALIDACPYDPASKAGELSLADCVFNAAFIQSAS